LELAAAPKLTVSTGHKLMHMLQPMQENVALSS